MYLIICEWEVPEEGYTSFLARLSEDEYKQVHRIFKWLEDHAGDEYGYTLPQWSLRPVISGIMVAESTEVIDYERLVVKIRENSRYDENIEFYGDRCFLLDD